jgi:CheY-like chemotaxis protein
MHEMSKHANHDFLSSWKEIAVHLGKGVRTVQRWERELGLPVHRPGHDTKGIVVASRAELDAWVKHQGPSRSSTRFASVGDFHYRILVVDDDERIVRVSQDVLSQGGYEVRTARDGFEALALMRKALPDLIISDLSMPNMSGFELLSVVRRRFPQIPVIVITDEFVATSRRAALLADMLFHKGQYTPEELFEEIRTLLDSSPIRPHMPKVDLAPVWIPRNGEYLVLTCPECLRGFSLPQEEPVNEPQDVSCIHCTRAFRFMSG